MRKVRRKRRNFTEEIETGRRQVIDLQSELRSKDEEIRTGEQQLTDLREKLEEKDANLVLHKERLGQNTNESLIYKDS